MVLIQRNVHILETCRCVRSIICFGFGRAGIECDEGCFVGLQGGRAGRGDDGTVDPRRPSVHGASPAGECFVSLSDVPFHTSTSFIHSYASRFVFLRIERADRPGDSGRSTTQPGPVGRAHPEDPPGTHGGAGRRRSPAHASRGGPVQLGRAAEDLGGDPVAGGARQPRARA